MQDLLPHEELEMLEVNDCADHVRDYALCIDQKIIVLRNLLFKLKKFKSRGIMPKKSCDDFYGITLFDRKLMEGLLSIIRVLNVIDVNFKSYDLSAILYMEENVDECDWKNVYDEALKYCEIGEYPTIKMINVARRELAKKENNQKQK